MHVVNRLTWKQNTHTHTQKESQCHPKLLVGFLTVYETILKHDAKLSTALAIRKFTVIHQNDQIVLINNPKKVMKYRRHQNIYRPYNLPKNALLTSGLQLKKGFIAKSDEKKRNGRKIMNYFWPHLEVKSKHLRINFQMMRRQWFGKLEVYKTFHRPGTVNQINSVHVSESQILQYATRKYSLGYQTPRMPFLRDLL